MNNITGSPVQGSDFHGRSHELEKLRRAIEIHKDILLLSPRRVGKSSLSLEMARRLRKDGWLIILCDAQAARTEADFLECFRDGFSGHKIPKKLMKRFEEFTDGFRKLFKGIKVGFSGASVEINDDTIIADWKDASKAVSDILAHLANQETPVFLVLDELPIFLRELLLQDESGDRARNILNWLRRTQGTTTKGLCWFLCGSIGLDSQVEYLKIPGVISNFEHHSVGAMPREDALSLLWALSTSSSIPVEMTNEVADRILQRTGWLIPNYLQLLYHFLSELQPDKRAQNYPSPEDVDTAYREMTSNAHSSKFAPWDTRLDEGFIEPKKSRLARRVLDQLCSKPDGLTSADLFELMLAKNQNEDLEEFRKTFADTLLLLDRDGYLIHQDGVTAFRSPVLRDYWHNRYSH